MSITEGKIAGLTAVSDNRGVIAAVAMDQRSSLKKALGTDVLGDDVSDQQLEEFKTTVTEILTPHASAVLLDPEWGLAASRRRAKNAGLLLAYEQSGYDHNRPGRIPELLPHYSVRRLKSAGADCCKVLLYYSPSENTDINDEKHAVIERVGEECRGNDIPFFLELVGYDPAGGDEKGPEYAKQKPDIVAKTISEFTRDRYSIDILKVEIPVNLRFVEGTQVFSGHRINSRKEAMSHLRAAAAQATKPFIYLSGGVSTAEFTESLELAADAGVTFNGVLCGRATWKGGIAVYAKGGVAALRAWLQDEGLNNLAKVNACMKWASPWSTIYHVHAA